MDNIQDVTNSPEDWDDFLNSPEDNDGWSSEDFEKIWDDMDEIESLHPTPL